MPLDTVTISAVLLGQSLKTGIESLAATDVPSPRMNAELLLMFALGCDRAYLYGHPERQLTAREEAIYEKALADRSRGIPAQYITGHQEFWGMDLIVTPAVLIPRPETEHVIERVLELCPPGDERRSPEAESCRIVDVGTGSGCISLALAKALPHAELHATEISEAALEIARANAARHQLENRICFHRCDLLAGMDAESFDIVVSNPPYVGQSEEEEVQLEVRKFEPGSAVFAGPTGLEVIERLIPEAWRVLKRQGWMVLEISGTIASRVRGSLRGWENVHIANDLRLIPRVLSARKPDRLKS